MLSRLVSAIRRRFQPRQAWVFDGVLHYSAGGREWRLPIIDIHRIDAYPAIEPPSSKFGIVYSGSTGSITTVEDMEGFLPVFREVCDRLGLEADDLANQMALRRHRNPVYQRQPTVAG
ncbi:hypothetical protein [Hyphobacterium sp.]|jgi:hypothetical protein|uniref:hypothetical protein n=1 Tax=Hyphobacterium sp. TaxID=2004662 RepID=UPI003BACD0D5